MKRNLEEECDKILDKNVGEFHKLSELKSKEDFVKFEKQIRGIFPNQRELKYQGYT